MNAAPIVLVVAVTIAVVSALMVVPALVGAWTGFGESEPFLIASAALFAPSVVAILVARRAGVSVAPRNAFLITTSAWLAAAAAGAVPLALHEQLRVVDAFFESMSGITTTGSTVLTGLDGRSPAVLLWRSLLQWLGGLGFIAMAIAVLPMVGVGGMRLFRTESSDWSEKAMPRMQDIALRIGLVYVSLSGACALAYWAFGMSPFDAINHAMTTLSTGGYSTSDLSMGKWATPAILWTSTVFMVLGALPFVLYLQSMRFGAVALLEDEQVRFFIRLVLVVVALGTVVLSPAPDVSTFEALTAVAFNAVSIMTTTGYASTDYTLWGEFFVAGFFFLMFTGGCSGSTSGSIKAFRVQIALRLLKAQLDKLVHPHGVFVVKLNGRRVRPDVANALVSFVFAVAATVTVVTMGLAAMGLDLVTALSAATTAVTNVGPGLGPIVGPAGNFSTLPDGAKWLLSAAMLLGRIELFTVIVLFSRSYWRN